MTTEEAVKIIEKYIADTKDFNKKMKNFGIKIEELAFYDEDMSFLNALNEEQSLCFSEIKKGFEKVK